MDNFRRLFKNVDKMLLLLPPVFAAISILMIASTSYSGSFVVSRDIVVQGVSYILGYICMLIILRFDYKIYPQFEKILYAASLLFLLTVYIPGLGIEQFNSRAWIDLKVTTLQPSEFVKISFTVLVAMYLSRHREDILHLKGIFAAFLYAAPFIAIVLKEDLGSAIVFGSIWICEIFFAGISYKWFGICAGGVVAAFPIFYKLMDQYQKDRILAFLHPEDLSLPGNYQVWQSKVAIGSGGLLGKGLFKGTQKSLKFLPVQKSDFIFAVICEELGAIGGIAVLTLYGLFISRIAKIARSAEDMYGALICIGFIGMFGFQILENIGMTIGIMPVTGVTLPLISYGGSSVLASMISISIILNISMRSKTLNF